MNKEKLNPLISVIIPVYNPDKKYFSRCLKSVLRQSYSSIEIIIVNDGSKDDKFIIQEKNKYKGKNINVINHEKNLGLFQARITGVENAKGKYIGFVDSDDYVSRNWFEDLVRKAEKSNSDIVVGEFFEDYGNYKAYYSLDPFRISDFDLSKEEALSFFISHEGTFYPLWAIWNKMYTKELWEKCFQFLKDFSQRHGHLVMFEDVIFLSELWLNASHIVNVHSGYYYYNKANDLSSTNTVSGNDFEKNVKYIKDGSSALKFVKSVLMQINKYENNEIRQSFFKWNYNAACTVYGDIWHSANEKYFYHLIKDSFSIPLSQDLKPFGDSKFYKSKRFVGLNFKKIFVQRIKQFVKKVVGYERVEELRKMVDSLNQKINCINRIEYEKLFYIWLIGDDARVCENMQYLSESESMWISHTPWIWLVYLSSLVFLKYDDKIIEKVIEKYRNMYGLDDVEYFLLVADYIVRNGLSKSELIDKSAGIHAYFNKVREEKTIENYLNGKRIALVGNGCSEIGKGKGVEIDSHDIVIRMNNYVTEGYENDYGTKTDIWIRNGSDLVEDRSANNNYFAVLHFVDYSHYPLSIDCLNIISRDIQKGVICTCSDYDLLQKLRNESKIEFPTTGLIALYWLKSLNLKQLDCYGFSFLEEKNEKRNLLNHYFKDDKVDENNKHQLDDEISFIVDKLGYRCTKNLFL